MRKTTEVIELTHPPERKRGREALSFMSMFWGRERSCALDRMTFERKMRWGVDIHAISIRVSLVVGTEVRDCKGSPNISPSRCQAPYNPFDEWSQNRTMHSEEAVLCVGVLL